MEMRRPNLHTRLPVLAMLAIAAAMLAHGPIVQPAGYHAFADASVVAGIPHAFDVLSNAGFAIAAAWGMAAWRGRTATPAGAVGWAMFLVGLLLTAFGSAWYHLAPDDARLVWDRLPIALTCAGLLAALRADTVPGCGGRVHLRDCIALAMLAVASVAWWTLTGAGPRGDLRPYLLIQLAPLVLVPLWQAIHGAPARDRAAFAIAIGLYVAAKACELSDHAILAATGWVSGHTLKHLLAVAAAFVVVARWRARLARQREA